MIVRTVFSLAVLALAGVLVVALFGHLWSRYQQETASLGFSGVYERLASQAGFSGGSDAYQAFEDEPVPPPVVREATAAEE
jgi:hypothetical protein